jgi:hypothetical protein
MSTLRLPILAFLLLTTFACTPEGEAPASMARVQEEVFDVGCNVSTCHSATAQAGDLVLEAGTSHEQLVDVPAFQQQAAAEGVIRVVPGDPDASFLITKCRGGIDSIYGEPMPWGGGMLDEDRLELLREWILDGAPAE